MAQLQGAVYPGGEVVFNYFGGGVQHASRNPYPLSDQVMQIFLANNFKPDVKFYVLYHTSVITFYSKNNIQFQNYHQNLYPISDKKNGATHTSFWDSRLNLGAFNKYVLWEWRGGGGVSGG